MNSDIISSLTNVVLMLLCTNGLLVTLIFAVLSLSKQFNAQVSVTVQKVTRMVEDSLDDEDNGNNWKRGYGDVE